MKRLLVAAIILFCPAALLSQCSTLPSNLILFENFNGTDLFAVNSQVGTNQSWVLTAGAATSASLIADSTNPLSLPNVLQLAQAATAVNIATYGKFEDVSGATTADIYVCLEQTATPGSFANVMSVLRNQSGASPMGLVTTTTPGYECFSGANFSATMAASDSAYHLLQCHIDATAANCYGSVDGGTHQTFTCANTGDFNEIKLDGQTATSDNVKIAWVGIGVGSGTLTCLGYICTGGQNPNMIWNGAGLTNGTVLAVANLGTATNGGNGVWTQSATPLTTFTATTSNTCTLPASQTVFGTVISGTPVTGIAETISSTKESITYTFLSPYTESTLGFCYYTTANPATVAKWDAVGLETISASGFIILYQQSLGTTNQLCLEQSSTGAGVGCTNILANHLYWVTLELNTNTLLALRVFDATTFLPVGPVIYGVGNTDTSVSNFIVGTALGAETGTPNGTTTITFPILDYTNSTFALFPSGVSFGTNP